MKYTSTGLVIDESVLKRFWAKVDRRSNDECWLWTGAVKSGWGEYGHIRLGGRNGRHVRANRLSWEIHYGPIPEGLLVCHNCPGGDNPRCVNPRHLFLDTSKGNTQDMVRKGRNQIGEEHPRAKLCEEDVLRILLEHSQGSSKRGIARRYGVTSGAILAIVRRKHWRHISDEQIDAYRQAHCA